MVITVKLRHLRIAPRKVRLVADMIRKKTVEQAESQLEFNVKKAVLPIKKLLHSGIATAENDFGKEKGNLFIKEIRVDEGVTLKRARPRAKGRVYRILKRSSHITLILDEIEPAQSQKGIVAGRSDKKQAQNQKDVTAGRLVQGQKTAEKDRQAVIEEKGKKELREQEPTQTPEEETKKKPESQRISQGKERSRIRAEKVKSKLPLKRVFRRKAF